METTKGPQVQVQIGDRIIVTESLHGFEKHENIAAPFEATITGFTFDDMPIIRPDGWYAEWVWRNKSFTLEK